LFALTRRDLYGLPKEFLKIGAYEVVKDHSIIVSGGTYKMIRKNNAYERTSRFFTPKEC
jgi:hypothetical protein